MGYDNEVCLEAIWGVSKPNRAVTYADFADFVASIEWKISLFLNSDCVQESYKILMAMLWPIEHKGLFDTWGLKRLKIKRLESV